MKELLKKTFVYKLYRKWLEIRERRYLPIKEKRSSFFNQEGVEVLRKFSNALNKDNILFWLDFGTLLGYYREHDFIAHDCDLDIGIYLEDAERARTALINHGFKLIKAYSVISDGGREECYLHEDLHTTIDVFYFLKQSDKMYCYLSNPIKDINKKKNINRILPFEVRQIYFPLGDFVKTQFKEVDVFVPKDIDSHLKYHYGEGYMIPNPKFSSRDRNNTIFYSYKEKPGIGISYFDYYGMLLSL